MDINLLIGLLTIIAFILLGYTQYESYSNEVTTIKSNVDQSEYIVRNREDKQEAADMLANIVSKLEKLINSMKIKYPNDESVNRMKNKFKRDNISESGKSSQYTSYSVNKGDKIVFCIRQKDDNESLVEMNTMMFVAIHELAHIMSKSIGHTDEFWRNFERLLEEAIIIGIYNKEDYSDKPKEYCGIKVTDSPLYK